MELHQEMLRLGMKNGLALEQAPKGSGHDTISARLQKAFGQLHSEIEIEYWVVLCEARNWNVILVYLF